MLKLPVIAANVSEFEGSITVKTEKEAEISGNGKVYVFKRAIYVQLNDRWYTYPCCQVYPLDDNTVLYKTDTFSVKKQVGNTVKVTANGSVEFELTGVLPVRKAFQESRPWLHPNRFWYGKSDVGEVQFQDQWVATVPVETCQEGFPDIGPYRTMDLMLNLKLPTNGPGPYPCILAIHGHGGD